MWKPKPRKHDVYRKHNHRVNRYPFANMLVNDYFEDHIGYEGTIRKAAWLAGKRFAPRKFSVKVFNNKVICMREE